MRALPTLLSAGALGLAVTAVAPAAAASDIWTIPAKARITVNGHGYGHGHGLSQYGAEGAARQGLTYRQILRFYYPGTDWARTGGRVKVLITADTSDDLVVLARRGLTIRDTSGGERRELPRNGATRWRVRKSDGDMVVSYLEGRWHRWRVLKGSGEFAAAGAPVTLVTPAGERRYRGKLRSVPTASGGRATVNDVGLGAYLKGVVPLEMPASWSRAAVRAQAVAARTYAAYERSHPRSSTYQLCDTTACQVYGGYDAEHAATNDAVEATANEMLASGGHPAFTQFSASSGGWTAKGPAPYLPAKRDPYDAWPGNYVHSWSTAMRDTRIEHHWPRIGNLTRIRVLDRDGNGEWGGRISSIRLVGFRDRVTVSGDTFRMALGLRSTWLAFKVTRRS